MHSVAYPRAAARPSRETPEPSRACKAAGTPATPSSLVVGRVREGAEGSGGTGAPGGVERAGDAGLTRSSGAGADVISGVNTKAGDRGTGAVKYVAAMAATVCVCLPCFMLRRMQLRQSRGRGFVGQKNAPKAGEAPMSVLFSVSERAAGARATRDTLNECVCHALPSRKIHDGVTN
jgi:hypothetical protein